MVHHSTVVNGNICRADLGWVLKVILCRTDVYMFVVDGFTKKVITDITYHELNQHFTLTERRNDSVIGITVRTRHSCGSQDLSLRLDGGTAAAAPLPFRPSNPALCGSCPLVTPYYCRLGDLLCYTCMLYLSVFFCVSMHVNFVFSLFFVLFSFTAFSFSTLILLVGSFDM